MKKTLTISLVDKNYLVKLSDDKKITVLGQDLILNAKDVFDNFFNDVELGKPLEAVIAIDSSVTGSHEEHIANEIKKILEDIVKRINAHSVEESNEEEAFVQWYLWFSRTSNIKMSSSI